MKKVLLIATIAFAYISLTSCRKNYTCECITSDSSGSQIQTTTFTVHSRKKDADAFCAELQSSVTTGTYTIAETCTIK